MSLQVTTAVVTLLLALFIWRIEGYERVIIINELDVKDHVTSGNVSSSSVFDNACCVNGNCSCPSLYAALSSLTSNVLINITTDVMLSSVVTLAYLTNITMTGHNNPTVDCSTPGGLNITSCHNCIIEGITWDGCGTSNNESVSSSVRLFNSSNITIKDCTFQHSTGQAVVLSDMTGDVNIDHCNFLSNKQYEGHGTAIHYSSNGVLTSNQIELIFMITNSNFFYNERAKSVVYFGQSSAKSYEHLNLLQNSKFYHNKGVSIYLYNQNLYINGSIQFDGNVAENGAGLYISNHSNVTFHKNAAVSFIHNRANRHGGAIFLTDHSGVLFSDHSTLYDDITDLTDSFITVAFYNNTDIGFGRDIYAYNSSIAVDNSAGSVHVNHYSTITFQGNCTITFSDYHSSDNNGGVIYTNEHSTIIFQDNSLVKFHSNSATNGGVIYIDNLSTMLFQGHCNVAFYQKFFGDNGGVIYIDNRSTMLFQGHSTVTFFHNGAIKGGIMYVDNFCDITFQGNSTVAFTFSSARENGGVLYIEMFSTITFKDNSNVIFSNNFAKANGGVIYSNSYFDMTFQGNSTVTFNDNDARANGGAMYTYGYLNIMFRENSKVILSNNTAVLGGSVFSQYSDITIEGNSSVKFINNTAIRDGGAMYLVYATFTQLDNSTVGFYYNKATDYGGAIYILVHLYSLDIPVDQNFKLLNAYSKDNTARAGAITNLLYINLPKTCNRSCLDGFNISNIEDFSTSPDKLVLYNYNPVKCNNQDCVTYYISNIMLGQEITFEACLLDYYGQPTEAEQFLITGMIHPDYNISTSSKYISISCNQTTEGISVIGNLKSNKSYNYSVNIFLLATRIAESKDVSVNLIIELSQCHPGFWYSDESKICECYDDNNIITCSSSNSTIKRGYWFGNISGKPAITSSGCPSDYCNFTCCEITSGIYHLYPVRADQCRPHRTGIACGDCEEGYTLSFDSPRCVHESECTIGPILVSTLSLLYWVAIVVAVFVMTYFKIAIGSLYAIVYYYSVVDILLSQVLFISNGLYTTVSLVSSLAKLTPQFLRQLCLVRNMSGIDQQVIHYVHPVVILLILIMLSVLARRSRRVSAFISRGIIHFICFILLLSYTSIATTSLLLLRPLTFINIDAVYTYLSPDTEYFRSRHLAYGIVALIFTMVIVIGFPLLLLLEPFLNSKINFFKIKPLLDQFQGCYKDKYRCFAGYYMICRLVIILLVIIKISDDFTTEYLLISSCALMQLIHVLVRPYASTFYNVFDGIILQLIVIISVLRMVELVGDNNETFVLVITYLLVIVPLTSFIAIKIWINRKNIQNTIKYLRRKCHRKYKLMPNNAAAEPEEEKELVVIDDNMRRNALVVDVDELSEAEMSDRYYLMYSN